MKDSEDNTLASQWRQISDEIGRCVEAGDGKEPGLKRSLLEHMVIEADRAMSHEHEGWRTVFGVRLPGP